MIMMRWIAVAAGVGLIAGASASMNARAGEPLPRSRPEAQGVSPSSLLEFVEAARKLDSLHGFVVVRHGKVVAEGWWKPYDAQTPHSLYSLSKSFTSTAVGLAVEEGKLSVNDPVLKFFPDDAPESPSNNLKAMRVSDLLRMSAGHQAEAGLAGKDQPWTRTFLAQPVPFKPGTHFMYNTPATYMLSAIVQKVTGQTTLDYLRPRLFEPLGIENPTWGTSPQGVSLGGYGLSIRTEDIARFGQLYLQKGMWEGKRLVPEAWVEKATTRQTSNGSNPNSDWEQGYGYQFWRCRNGAYRGDGAFGQYCVVIPEQDAVVAINSGLGDLQSVLNVVWDKLLPGMSASPIAEDDATVEKLKAAIGSLTIPPVEGEAFAESAGKYVDKKFSLDANDRKVESITVGRNAKGTTLTVRTDGRDETLTLEPGQWSKTKFGFGPLEPQVAAATGAWTGPDTLVARVAFVETPFVATLRMKFDGDDLEVEVSSNVGFGANRPVKLNAKVR